MTFRKAFYLFVMRNRMLLQLT